MPVKLGVNIDHVATLRQARLAVDPDPVAAARVCRLAGADMIVAHLRQDRRHIQERDLLELSRVLRGGLHLELAAVPAMLALALRIKPDSVCLVPEKPGEVSTQGGLDLSRGAVASRVGRAAARLKRAGIGVSLFVDPEAACVRAARKLGADTVEFCTRAYARAEGKHAQRSELERLELAAYLARELRLELHAGHDLDYHNVVPVAQIPGLRCLNIGFSIVARSVFTGLKGAVAEMKKLIAGAR